MLLEGNKIWLFVAELVANGISDYTIRDAIRRNRQGKISTWKHKADTSDKRIKLIDYDSLPETTKSKLPSRAELVKLCQANTTEAQLDIYEEACYSLQELHKQNSLVTDYHFFLKNTNDAAKSEDLKQAAGWLRLLNKYRTPRETRTINFNTKAELRTAVLTQLLADFRKHKAHLYGFKVTNVTVLQRKELEWSKQFQLAFEGYSNEPKIERERKANEAALGTLIHANIGNNNRRIIGKLNPDEKQRILLPSGRIDFSEWNARTLVYLFMNPGQANKWDFENIYRRYQAECKKENREPEVEISAVKEFLTCDEVKLYTLRERNGFAELDKMLPTVYGKRPEYSLTKGGYDGFQVDFNSKIEGKQLMLTVVAAFDYMSEAITGFDVNLVEDGLMVRNMYRNHLNLLGGRSFIEIESDRFSGNLAAETKQIFEKTCQFVTQPMPNDLEGKAPNPKARFVERLLQELNRLTQNFPGWKGTNITSIDKNRKPNPDYRSGNYVEGFAESVKQIIDLINIYNNDVYNRSKSRMAVLLENINPAAPLIPHESIVQLLNQNTITTVRNGKISIEVNRREYEYAFPTFDQHVHKMMKGYKVKVYFDETDMSSVDLFGENDQYIIRLERLARVARDKFTLTSNEEERNRIGKMTNDRNQTRERVTRKALEVEASVYGLDISNLSLEDALEIIEGARLTMGAEKRIQPEELFADALATPNAQLTRSYYEDRLLRANGEVVPVSKEDRKGIEDERREYERERAKRKGHY